MMRRKNLKMFKSLLVGTKVPFVIDNTLVRGLDYYCHTVFEFKTDKTDKLGSHIILLLEEADMMVLIKIIGGPDIPGVGWAGGIERLMLLMESTKRRIILNIILL